MYGIAIANEGQLFLFQRTLIFDTSGLVSRGKEEWVERHLKYVDMSTGKGKRLIALQRAMFLGLSDEGTPVLRKTTDGMTWEAGPFGSNLAVRHPQFISQSGTTDRIFLLFTDSAKNLSLSRSSDSCTTFSSPVTLDTASRSAYGITTDNSSMLYVGWLHEVYGDTKILGVRSTDDGQSWNSFTNIPLSRTHSISFDMIAGDSGKLLITALDAEQRKLKGYYTTDGGSSWDSSEITTLPEGFTLKGTSLASDSSGSIHCTTTMLSYSGTWSLDAPSLRILHNVSADGGKTWSKEHVVDSIQYEQRSFWTPYALSFETALLATSHSLYLSWTEPLENVGPNTIYYRKLYLMRSTDNGSTWGPRIQINDSSKGTRGSPHLNLRQSVDGIDSIYITWVDGRDVRYLQNTVRQTTQSIDIRPNPATDQITISSLAGPAAFEIYNALGTSVKSGELQLSSAQIDCYDLPAGAYVIKLTSGSDIHFSQFIIRK